MGKAYSNKALPPGTVLREWRLEDVLGVGGFGIVYKGRGIYFDELVAIKEYFPSAISERDGDDTVVPIDSDAEEVHALGLKKFVEEAKLLWNLSTPTRHPNIVSVRALFEVHGTAYMVMDFEDGISLSKLLKDGKKFDEEGLASLVLPIVEGLDRAHRVGVLHRDIKPANIIVNHDERRAVLIDFGSARFESSDATSTKVTFHTPPYAAIEQYVKTYDQGPWTDIYALGVVLYECVTGTKPDEVLERLHGEAGQKLADGDWPGFSPAFLAAIDAAMIIKPSDRPQSISEWLAMLRGEDVSHEDEGERTRIGAYEGDPHEIKPVMPPAELTAERTEREGKPAKEMALPPPTAEEMAAASQMAATAEAAPASPPPQASPPPTDPGADSKEKVAALRGKEGDAAKVEKKDETKKSRMPLLLVGGALAALLALAFLFWPKGAGDDAIAEGDAPSLEGVIDVDELDNSLAAQGDEATNEIVAEEDIAPEAETPAPREQRPERQVQAERQAEPEVAAPVVAAPVQSAGVTSAQRSRLASLVSEGKGMAREVIRMGERARRPGRRASDEEQESYRVLRENIGTARGYDDYLDTLANSMRGVSTNAEAQQLISQAEQTRRYLVFLRDRSRALSQ
ncbi:serine/threonine protein kinase [Sphingomicrobium flavum]|uniref:serine/threonine protein kinase n=1 Tax=Sphingomicrobium flavum TaxID=1229164 RepID=UPI0021AD6AAC|nr:serine/threonine-protein kinase [Sphingomicrobium flavum]